MLPWTEKHRPKSLSEVIGHEKIIKRLKRTVKNIKHGFPNMLFYGPSGVGKTSTAWGLANDLYGDKIEYCVKE